MAARTGCMYLIHRLRSMVDDTAEATWEDDELQDILDAHRRLVSREKLTSITDRSPGGTVTYTEYFSRYGWFEETTGGTARFVVRGAGGTVQGTANWVANYIQGQLTFGTTQAGSARYLTGYSYDVPAAAADCWRDKAGITAAYYDFQSGNARISRGQWFDHCMQMADLHARRSIPMVVERFTDDDL